MVQYRMLDDSDKEQLEKLVVLVSADWAFNYIHYEVIAMSIRGQRQWGIIKARR